MDQRRIAQRIDVDDAAYRLHGQKLAGRAFSREWNDVGDILHQMQQLAIGSILEWCGRQTIHGAVL